MESMIDEITDAVEIEGASANHSHAIHALSGEITTNLLFILPSRQVSFDRE